MKETTQNMADRKTTASRDASDFAHEANTSARTAEIEAVLERVIKKQFQVEDHENEGNKRFINLGRVPLICQSIVTIDTRLKQIESNLSKGVWILISAFIGGLIMLLIK